MAATHNLTDLTVHLPADIARFISEVVGTGEFATASDVVEEALRSLAEHHLPPEQIPTLREGWQQAMANQEPTLTEEDVFEPLLAKYEALALAEQPKS